MIYYHCKRCNLDSAGDVCSGCGKRIPPSNQQDIWSIFVLPVTDGRIWLHALATIAGAVALLLLGVTGAELILGGAERTAAMWRGLLPRAALALIPAGLAVVFIFLLLQGREIQMFTLNPRCARLQTWHAPHKWQSWTRLQSADPKKDMLFQDGTVMHLSQERTLLWQDVVDVKFMPRQSVILLYHTPHFAPLALRLPAGEYDLAAAYVGKFCKRK